MKIPRRINSIDENKDRLSDLCDYLLIHILSFLESEKAVQTCILSTRWRNLWKQLPFLSLYCYCFKTLQGLTQFASQFLSLRDGSTSLIFVKLYNIFSEGIMEPHLLDTILQYAVSHNIQDLDIFVSCDIQHFPSCLFSCDTLTSLRFFVTPIGYDKPNILFPNSLNFPSLTSLRLGFVAFQGGLELLRAYPRLKHLEIAHFEILGEENLYISSTTLVRLAIKVYFEPKNNHKIELFTPNLCAFVFDGTPFPILSGSPLSSVKHIEIDADMWWNYAEASSILLRWFLEFVDIELLIISSNTLQVLSLVPDLLKVKLSSLRNMKSLKVERKTLSYRLSKILIDANLTQLPPRSEKEAAQLQEVFKVGSSSIPDEIIDFLLQNSTSKEFHIIN